MDADPRRTAFHERFLPEAELFGLDVEVEIEEEMLALIEGGRFADKEDVEAREALLPIQKELRVPV